VLSGVATRTCNAGVLSGAPQTCARERFWIVSLRLVRYDVLPSCLPVLTDMRSCLCSGALPFGERGRERQQRHLQQRPSDGGAFRLCVAASTWVLCQQGRCVWALRMSWSVCIARLHVIRRNANPECSPCCSQSCSISCNGPNYVMTGVSSRVCSGDVLNGAPQSCARMR
jgi:hypothetical protein